MFASTRRDPATLELFLRLAAEAGMPPHEMETPAPVFFPRDPAAAVLLHRLELGAA